VCRINTDSPPLPLGLRRHPRRMHARGRRRKSAELKAGVGRRFTLGVKTAYLRKAPPFPFRDERGAPVAYHRASQLLPEGYNNPGLVPRRMGATWKRESEGLLHHTGDAAYLASALGGEALDLHASSRSAEFSESTKFRSSPTLRVFRAPVTIKRGDPTVCARPTHHRAPR